MNNFNEISAKTINNNHSEIYINGKYYLISYNSVVAIIDIGDMSAELNPNKNLFSRTTTKHVNQWLELHNIHKKVKDLI